MHNERTITRRGLIAGLGAALAGYALHESGLLVPEEPMITEADITPEEAFHGRSFAQVPRNAPVASRIPEHQITLELMARPAGEIAWRVVGSGSWTPQSGGVAWYGSVFANYTLAR